MNKTAYTIDAGDHSLASYIARCTQLAMCLEVSANPKPGNIDRYHDYEDTRYEHFLSSAIAVHPVIEKASSNATGVGRYIRSAVIESARWQKGGNTHFGALILLIPLVMAAGRILRDGDTFTIEQLTESAFEIVSNTNSQDAVDFYSCFKAAGVRVNPVEEYDLLKRSAIDEVKEKDITLYELMKIARGYDLIAREWVNCFKGCALCSEMLIDCMKGRIYFQNLKEDINNVIVFVYLKMLSQNPDTFISTKYDYETAIYVSGKAKSIIEKMKDENVDFNNILPLIEDLDKELLEKKINPGSTADIIIAGLFIVMLTGVRF